VLASPHRLSIAQLNLIALTLEVCNQLNRVANASDKDCVQHLDFVRRIRRTHIRLASICGRPPRFADQDNAVRGGLLVTP